MKRKLLLLVLALAPLLSFAQGYNLGKTALTRFLVRMYETLHLKE